MNWNSEIIAAVVVVLFSFMCSCGFFWLVKSLCTKKTRDALSKVDLACALILAIAFLGAAISGVSSIVPIFLR